MRPQKTLKKEEQPDTEECPGGGGSAENQHAEAFLNHKGGLYFESTVDGRRPGCVIPGTFPISRGIRMVWSFLSEVWIAALWIGLEIVVQILRRVE